MGSGSAVGMCSNYAELSYYGHLVEPNLPKGHVECWKIYLELAADCRRITGNSEVIHLSPGKFECIGRRRSAWCRKAELSGR